MDNIDKKPFTAPELIEFGRLSQITQVKHYDKDPKGWAWGHYKDHGRELNSVFLNSTS